MLVFVRQLTKRISVAPIGIALLIAMPTPGPTVAAPPPIATTLTAVSSPDPAWVGDTVTITFTVTPIPDGGYVTLGGPGIPVDPSTGTATYVRSDTTFGAPDLVAWYQGTDRFLSSPLITVHSELRQHPVTATLQVPDGPVGRGDPFEVVVDLDEVPDGGRIQIQDMANGSPGPTLRYADATGPMPMTITMPGLEPRSYDLRAVFEGTPAYTSAVSATHPLVVFDRITTATVSTTPTSTRWGEPATVSVTFDPIPDDGGAVALIVDGSNRDWFPMDWTVGSGSLPLPYLEPGEHVIEARLQPSAYPVFRWAPTTGQVTHSVSPDPIDRDPPIGNVTINDGAAVAFDAYVVVSMSATDASSISDVKMSCDGTTWVAGGTVSGTWGWGFGNESCDASEGLKTVFVRWIDIYGNVGIASDSIVLDWQGPTGQAVVSDDDPFATTTSVTVAVPASDAGSGVSLVGLSNDGVSWSPRPYAPTIPWSLDGADGAKTVYVRWRDGNGHWSPAVSDSIVLDRTAPSGTVAIDAGAARASTPVVNVSAAATDAGSGLSQISISNDGAAWTTRAYAPTQAWTLTAIDGERTVFIRLRDAAGNWSTTLSDTILLDTIAPSVSGPRSGYVREATVSTAGRIDLRLSWTGADAGAGIARYELAQRVDGGAWATVATSLTSRTVTRSVAHGHRYVFRVRGVDRAGNVSAWVTGSPTTVSRFQESSSRVSYAGTWRTATGTRFLGGAARKSSAAGAKASITFTGRSIAWVARTGPDRGKAAVFVNGVRVATVDLYAPTYQSRRVVWAGTWASATSRKVTVRVSGTSGRPRVDLDAFFTSN